MDNTKWNEIFINFYKNECDKGVLVQWRTKHIETGYICSRGDGMSLSSEKFRYTYQY